MKQTQITIVVALITNDRGEVLLARRHQPDFPQIHNKWEFPGGGIDFGEDPLEALKREVREEVGVEIEILRLLPKVLSDMQKFEEGNELQVVVLSYECKILSGTPSAEQDEEIAELKFVALTEVKNYDCFRNVYESLKLLN